MPCLTLLPLGKKIKVDANTTVLAAIREAGIEIPSPCNGQQLCGKCKVHIDPSPPMRPPHKHLTFDEIKDGVRLACEVVVQEDITVTLQDDYSIDIRVLEGELIKIGHNAPAAAIEKTNGRYWLTYHGQPPEPLKEWQESWSPTGIVVDLGTTTLVATLIDLRSGTEKATVSSVNPQIRFGHDVMSRIKHASTEKGLVELAGLIANGLNDLIAKTCNRSATLPHQIIDVVIGGNTTMLQIAAAIDPSPLGVAPFTVGIQGGRTYPADHFGLNLNPQARVYIPPVAHAFIGADLSAGLLSIDAFNEEVPVMFIDIGTNGEMAIVANDRVVVTSTAAGPAFEGMGIRHGMSASTGAIEMVWNNGSYLNYRTIDDAPAAGICGSGIIDIIASLIDSGTVEPSGRLQAPRKDRLDWGPFADRYEIVDGIAAIKLTGDIYLTQRDIRQFQLAKSAIRTSFDMLLSAAKTKMKMLQKIVIAGAFGYHLKPDSLRKIGIVPAKFTGEIHFAGNTCRIGCARMLMDAIARDFLQQQMGRVEHLSIVENPDFKSKFFSNMALGNGKHLRRDRIS